MALSATDILGNLVFWVQPLDWVTFLAMSGQVAAVACNRRSGSRVWHFGA